ncbi:MAG: phosphatidate cytidylyltransferase [bacterium]|nr:phosphatidate cytidylyltransferase [bacterium]
MTNWINIGVLGTAFLVLFAVAELLYHRFNYHAEVTRKIVHISTGILTLLFPPMLENHWSVLALCASFLLILIASWPLKLLPSINAVKRKTTGSILYPIIVYGCFLNYNYFDNFALYYIPILTLALCDPVAAYVGQKYPYKPYIVFRQKKTLSGSLGFAVAAFVLSFAFLIGLEQYSFIHAVVIGFALSICTTFAEGISHGGYDNFTIPFAATVVLMIAEYFLNYA